MSQILIVMLYVLWVAALPARLPRAGAIDVDRLVVFLAGFVVIVLTVGVSARWLARRADPRDTWTMLRRFHWLSEAARFGIAGWFATGLFASETWLAVVGAVVGSAGDQPFSLTGMVVGPLPAVMAWVGLWWAQYPIDRLAREQSLLPMLQSDLPIHAPPTMREFMLSNLRMQVLTTTVPLLMIAALRDAGALVMLWTGMLDPSSSGVSAALSFGAALVVLLIAPEPLRRILHSERLPPSSLRWRLDAVSRAARTRYRDVLLWKTGYVMGNAAVMGVLPQLRYVMLSDLLLETMTDRQIEAVFAHELGHVVYRHTVWFVLLVMALAMWMSGVGAVVDWSISRWELAEWVQTAVNVGVGIGLVLGAIATFGLVSRRFERQADVYAARLLQSMQSPAGIDPRRTEVGPEGAEAIGSALARAAFINNVPMEARSFRHGSIARRIRYIRSLAREPHLTLRFDRAMSLLFAGITFATASGLGLLVWLESL